MHSCDVNSSLFLVAQSVILCVNLFSYLIDWCPVHYHFFDFMVPQMSCTPVFVDLYFLSCPSYSYSYHYSFHSILFSPNVFRRYTRGQVWCTDQIPYSSGRLEGLSHEVYQQVINVVIFDPTSRQLINDRAPKQYSCPHQLYFEDELWMFEWNICFEYPLWIAVFWSRSVVGETLSNVHLPMKRQVWHIAVVHFSIF